MTYRNKVYHEVWAHSKKVANVTLANPRNQYNWIFQDLVIQIFSTWCTTWFSVIIWIFEHFHKNIDQKETIGNVELLKFGSGQEWFLGTFVNQNYFYWDETFQDHHIRHMWLAKIVLDLFDNISYRNISNTWKCRNGFGGFCPIFLTWPCVETHIYGKYMSTEFP